MADVKHTPAPDNMKVGGLYNWRNQPERLAYMGREFYRGDRRAWHQFEKVDEPGKVWCEILDSDLRLLEETEPIGGAARATEGSV